MTEQNTEQTATEAQDDAQDRVEAQDAQEATEQPQDEQETFPRSYVEELRQENGRYRQRAARAGDLAAALWTARVEATGRLADPSDLPIPEDGDPLDVEAVTAAVDHLLERKPHLASRRPRGDVGQGVGASSTSTDLAGLLRSRA